VRGVEGAVIGEELPEGRDVIFGIVERRAEGDAGRFRTFPLKETSNY
jgi:hypothetical protein